MAKELICCDKDVRMIPDGWWICGVDGCLVSPEDPRCPACEFRLLGPRESDL